MAIPRTLPEKLRWQRNLAAVGAVLLLAASLAIVLPGFLKRQNELKAADTELIDLEKQILTTQQRTRDIQAEIIRTQSQISDLRNRSR